MKNIILLLILGSVFGGCKKQLSDVPDAPVVVKGYLYGGEEINSIYLESVATTREFEQQVNQPITNAEVSLTVNDQTITLIPDPAREGFYMSEGDTVLLDENYDLLVEYQGQSISASCYVPDRLEVTNSVPSDEVFLEPQPSDLIASLSWVTSNPDIEFLIALTPNAENLEPLSFGDQGNKFNDLYALPIRENFAILDASFFTYKGSHSITVFSISKEYSDYLNYLPTSFDRSLYKSPNNITNGYGVFAGLTGTTIEVTLDE